MVEAIKRALKKRKVKVFSIFFLIATLAWLINTLSETHTGSLVFDLEYDNVPDDMMLMNASQDKIKIKIEALGFQFFGLDFKNKKLRIDLKALQKKEGVFYISEKVYHRQIDEQLSGPIKLIEIEGEALFFDFQKVISKKIPVIANVNLSLAQNYLLDGELLVTPDSITIKGPKSEVDTIRKIKSTKIDLIDLNEDFSKKASIVKWEALKKTTFSDASVRIHGTVSRFSEKEVLVKIKPLNLPDSTFVKMFPEEVSLLCKGTLQLLKELNASDFEVVANYENTTNAKIPLTITKQPSNLYSVILQESEVEFILKRK